MRQKSLKTIPVDGDTTTDDSANEDLEHQDRPPQGLASTFSSTRFPSPKSSIGGEIRVSTKPTYNAAPMSTSARRVPRSPMTKSTANDTDSEDDQCSPPVEADSKASTSSAAKAKHKLGKIGIRSRKETRDDAEEDISPHNPVLDDTSQNEPPFKKHKHKLGKIGGKARTAEPRDKSIDSPIQDVSSPFHNNESSPESQHSNTGYVLPKMQQDSSTVKKSMVRDIPETPGKVSDMQANENRKRLKLELDTKSNNAKRKKRKF